MLKNLAYKLLRRSEKYTKTDMVYLAKGGFWLTIGQVASSFAAFILAVAFANFLSPETYGSYKYVISIVSILAIFTLPNMSIAFIRSVSQNKEGNIKDIINKKIKWGLIASFIALIFAIYYFLKNDSALAITFIIASIFLPVFNTFKIHYALLQGRKEFAISSKYLIWNQILPSLLMIIIVFFYKNIYVIVSSYFIIWTIVNTIFYKISIKKYPPNNNKDGEVVNYGRDLSLMNILPTIVQYIDGILIFFYLGPVNLAIYSFAIAIPEQIKGLFKNTQMLILPKFSENNNYNLKNNLKRKILQASGALIIVTILYIIIAPFVYKIFFHQYLNSINYSQIFAISIIFVSSVLPLSALQAKLAKKELYKFNTIRSILQICLVYFLVKYYGIWGAIISRILIDFINLLVLSLLTKNKLS